MSKELFYLVVSLKPQFSEKERHETAGKIIKLLEPKEGDGEIATRFSFSEDITKILLIWSEIKKVLKGRGEAILIRHSNCGRAVFPDNLELSANNLPQDITKTVNASIKMLNPE